MKSVQYLHLIRNRYGDLNNLTDGPARGPARPGAEFASSLLGELVAWPSFSASRPGESGEETTRCAADTKGSGLVGRQVRHLSQEPGGGPKSASRAKPYAPRGAFAFGSAGKLLGTAGTVTGPGQASPTVAEPPRCALPNLCWRRGFEA